MDVKEQIAEKKDALYQALEAFLASPEGLFEYVELSLCIDSLPAGSLTREEYEDIWDKLEHCESPNSNSMLFKLLTWDVDAHQ